MTEEFSHDGCEGEFFWFCVREESLVIFFKDWVESGGYESGEGKGVCP